MSSLNNSSNVSAAKPNISGAIYRAPLNTALPTTADGTLTGFTCLGYISEDGITNSNSRESDEFKAWGGDTVLTSQTSYKDTFQFKLLEYLNADVKKTVFGADNVSGALETGLTVQANSKELTSYAWVIDMVMRDDTMNRIVIPSGKISEVGDVVYSDSELTAYDVTVTAFPDSSGNTHYEYIKAAPVTT